MESIESDYESLRGVLPKSEYQELDNAVLGQLLRTLNPDELKKVSGDVFGRIYEYFLTQFADQKAHDGGEFFTPISLVSLIAHVLEPESGTVLDPALYVVDFKGTQPRFAAYFPKNALRNYQSDKAAVPGVDRNVLHELKVRAPDSSKQESIAGILSAYDDLIENNGRRIRLLEQAARLLY
jgi:hypothetical protein